MRGKQFKVYFFLSVYGTENIFRLCTEHCLFVFLCDRCEHNLHRFKKILQQSDKQRIFIFVSCVDSSGGNAGFFGNLVERGFTKAVSKKL